MTKYTIAIEEIVVDEFEIVAETEKEALEIAQEKYKNKEFVLEPGEVQHTQMAIIQPYREKIEWSEV